MAAKLKVKNWEKHQHYKDRSPPWIKLHGSLLTDYEFTCLNDASKLHLIMIWLLARETNGVIPDDPKWVQKCAGLDSEVDITPLKTHGFLIPLQDASTMHTNASEVLATCNPEERRGEERRGEGEAARPPVFQTTTEISQDDIPAKAVESYQRRRYKRPDRHASYYAAVLQEACDIFSCHSDPAKALEKFQEACRAPPSIQLPADASFSDIAIYCGLKQRKVKAGSLPRPVYRDYTAERLSGGAM